MARRPRIEGIQAWLYVIIVSGLTLYLVLGILAWTWMIMTGVPAPDAFVTILAAITGALAGIVTPLKGPRANEPQRPPDGGDG